MLKSELIEQLSYKLQIPLSQADKYLDTLIRTIYKELHSGGEVLISGFGKFRPYQYKSRIGVNPRNPKVKIDIKSRRIPKFTPGEAFKSAVAIKK